MRSKATLPVARPVFSNILNPMNPKTRLEWYMAWLSVAAIVADCLFLLFRPSRLARLFSVNSSQLIKKLCEVETKWEAM
jgi:hypothetical protein